jgi:DNA-binding transcriptional ArsR family regulator
VEYFIRMSVPAALPDPFTAISEPRRREVLGILARGERPVNDLVDELGLAQSVVSKHLAVLRGAGLVTVRKDGRQRVYQLNADPLKPIADWVGSFEQFWTHHLTGIKAKAEAVAKRAAEAKSKTKE